MKLPAVSNISQMVSDHSNRAVANQFIISHVDGSLTFKSYNSIIAHRSSDWETVVLGPDHDFSQTTVKYRNMFLSMDTKRIRELIKEGDIPVEELTL